MVKSAYYKRLAITIISLNVVVVYIRSLHATGHPHVSENGIGVGWYALCVTRYSSSGRVATDVITSRANRCSFHPSSWVSDFAAFTDNRHLLKRLRNFNSLTISFKSKQVKLKNLESFLLSYLMKYTQWNIFLKNHFEYFKIRKHIQLRCLKSK